MEKARNMKKMKNNAKTQLEMIQEMQNKEAQNKEAVRIVTTAQAREFLTVQDVSILTGFCTKTVRKLFMSDGFPMVQFGHQWLVRRTDYEAWIQKNKRAN